MKEWRARRRDGVARSRDRSERAGIGRSFGPQALPHRGLLPEHLHSGITGILPVDAIDTRGARRRGVDPIGHGAPAAIKHAR
jgi:hypothetical protein